MLLSVLKLNFIAYKGGNMRTTLDIPEGLLEEAQKLTGFKSKTDIVILSLQELIRQRRVDELKSLAGKIDLRIDLKKQRKRVG